jgi:hypothetical protein
MIVHNVEQGTDEWFALRCGIPTGSEFKKLVTSKGEPSKTLSTYAITLANEKYAGKPVDAWEGNGWTERGKELEDEAISLYEFVNDVTVERVGFITLDDGTAGCSPDGMVGDDGMLEVKCLKSETHTKTIMYYQKHGKCPTDYVQQTQGQIMIAEREWCDLIFYHPILPQLTIRRHKDSALQSAIMLGIKDVLAERDTVLAALHTQGKG